VKVVLCTAPLEAAELLASKLVGERLAACVNVVRGVASIYRWQGALERSEEALLVMKTSDSALGALVARIARIHPYSVPEIVALDVVRVNAKYLEWVDSETSGARFLSEMSKEFVSADDEGSERGVSPRRDSRSSCMEGTMAKKKAAKKAAKKSTAKKTKKKR
jgi:periplasmic divalent cation tolerance protein